LKSRLQFDGDTVRKTFGLKQEKFLENEVAALKHLEKMGCDYVPRLIAVEGRTVVMTKVPGEQTHIGEQRLKSLFAGLLQYGVKHDDEWVGNVLFDKENSKFYIVDFEYSTIDAPPLL